MNGARRLMAAFEERPELLPPGTVFTDSPEPWAPEMVVVPACPEGFLMGSQDIHPGWSEDEVREGRVRIPRNFALARFALTFAEYAFFCDETGRERPPDHGWGGGRMPVTDVSWRDAMDYLAWLSEKTGAAYRLPSEAEWEYACRGDPTGENITLFCPEVAREGAGAFVTAAEFNYDANDTFFGSPKGEYRGRPVPVDHAAFRPNGFGLWQMHGNVWEWCADAYEADYAKTPADGTPHRAEFIGDCGPVLRGGSWATIPEFLFSAYRDWDSPDARNDDIGFRPARTLSS